MVPVSSIILMALGAVIGVALPILMAVWLVKKYHVSPATIVVGALVFIVFALGLESVVHQIVLKGPKGPEIVGNIWLYALYGAGMAALFEETGRFVAMKWVLKQAPGKPKTGVAYGFGHGGIEMFMLFGIAMISNIVISLMINAGKTDLLLATVQPDALEQAQTQLDALQNITAAGLGWSMLERFSAVLLQVSISVMMWMCVRKRGKWLWLIPAMYLVHFLADAIVVVIAKNATIAATEIILLCLSLAIGAAALLLSRRFNNLST